MSNIAAKSVTRLQAIEPKHQSTPSYMTLRSQSTLKNAAERWRAGAMRAGEIAGVYCSLSSPFRSALSTQSNVSTSVHRVLLFLGSKVGRLLLIHLRQCAALVAGVDIGVLTGVFSCCIIGTVQHSPIQCVVGRSRCCGKWMIWMGHAGRPHRFRI